MDAIPNLAVDTPGFHPGNICRKTAGVAPTIYTDQTSRRKQSFCPVGSDRLNTETLQQHKPKSHIQGLRAVAVLEIAKGVGAVLFGIWLLSFRDKDIGDMMANLLDRMHVDPAHEFAVKLVSVADKITPEKVVIAAIIAFLYAIVRFTEGYGLWNARTWAEWFALLSGAAYLPWELWEFLRRPNWFHATLILINVMVVLYIAYVRVQVHHEHTSAPPSLNPS